MIFFIIKMIFLTTVFTLGWRVAISDDMIFERVGKWGEKKDAQGYKMAAIIICPWCIPNIMGLLIVWPLAFGMEIMPFVFDWKYVFAYPFCVCGSSFISGILWDFYTTMNAKRDYYKSNTQYEEIHEDHFNSERK